MKLVSSLSAALTAILAACSYSPPALPPPPAGATQAVVEGNADAARVLAGLRARGLPLAPSDVSQVDLLAGSPGYAWSVGSSDWLHLHVYRDRASAAAAANRFVATAMSRSQIIDWVGKPHLFQCGTTLALYLGEMPQALAVLTNQCGAPVWQR